MIMKIVGSGFGLFVLLFLSQGVATAPHMASWAWWVGLMVGIGVLGFLCWFIREAGIKGVALLAFVPGMVAFITWVLGIALEMTKSPFL